MVQLLEEQSRVRTVARRSAAVARLIREAYPLTRLDSPIEEIAGRFLQTVINAVGVDNAMVLRYDRTRELLHVEHALGFPRGDTSISLSSKLLTEFCPSNSRTPPDPLVTGLRALAGVPYLLFAFHSESGLGLILGNTIEDRSLRSAFDDKDREIVENALQVFIHILDHKHTETAIRESEERWKTVLHSIHAGIMIIDAETHKILYANNLASAAIGLSSKELEGAVCHKYVCPAEFGKCPITDLGQVVDRSERVLLTVAGERVPIIKSVTPIVLEGGKVLLESFVDISDRKRMEEELQHRAEETERINRLMRGRENRILELKGVINDLLIRLGESPRYASVSALGKVEQTV